MAAPTIAIEMCLAGRLRQKLIDAGATAIWPLHDTFGSEVEEIVGDFVGDSNDISRGDAGMIPEYGCCSTFNEASSTFSVDHAAALVPSSTFAVAFILTLTDTTISGNQTIIRKENGGTGGRIVVGLKSSGPKLYFGLNIGASYAELEYTIASPSDWVSNPRLIICKYDGTNKSIVQVTMAGTVTTLATTAASGAIAAGTGSDIYVGSSAGSSEYFGGALQWLAWWVNDAPTSGEITDFAASLKWTDVTADVLARDGIEAEWGIRENGPSARLGSTGTLQFSLDNSAANSGGLLGYYSLDHANKRTGFGYGNMVRLSITNAANGVTTRRFVGKLIDIDTEPGQYRGRSTRCLAVDYFDELAGPLPNIPIVDNYTTGDILGRIVQFLPVKPHQMDALDDGIETFQYGFDRSQSENDPVLKELRGLVDSELAGGVYMRGNSRSGGCFTFDDRRARPEKTSVDWTFSNSMVELETGRRRGELVSRVQVTTHPRDIDAVANQVLYSIESPIEVQPGETRLLCDYRDPDDPTRRIGGDDIVDPLVSGTDFIANAEEDGSGAVTTSALSIAFDGEPGANSSTLVVTNGSSEPQWVTTLQIRGKRVRTLEPVVAEVINDELRATHGNVTLAVDMPFQDDPSVGTAACIYLANAWATERTLARALTIRAGASSAAALMTAALGADCGDLVALTETVSGLASAEYFVNGVQMRISPGPVLETTLTLAPREQDMVWLLGVVGSSEIGSTAVPGY